MTVISDSGMGIKSQILHTFAKGKMVLQSRILKRFLAGTYTNQSSYLNRVSGSEKNVDFKNYSFPKLFHEKIHFKIFENEVSVHENFLL